MLLFDGFAGLLAFGVWLFCIIDVITTPDERVRNLPKLLWLLVVILLIDIGSIAWLVAGRDWSSTPTRVPRESRTPSRPTTPDDDQEFLEGLRRRAEEQRRRARDAPEDDQAQDGSV